MKKTPLEDGERRDSEACVPESAFAIPFRITRLERIGPFGSKVAAGAFEIEGLGSLNFECFLRDNVLSVAPESVRSKFTGVYTRTCKFEAAFKASLADAVWARLDAEEHAE